MRDLNLIYNYKALTLILDKPTAKAILMLQGELKAEYEGVFVEVLNNLSDRQVEYLQTFKESTPNTLSSIKNVVNKELKKMHSFVSVVRLAGIIEILTNIYSDNHEIMARDISLFKKEFAKLSEQQKEVLISHYGLLNGKKISIDEIAYNLNLTRPKVRQTETEAIEQLKSKMLITNGVKIFKRVILVTEKEELKEIVSNIENIKIKELVCDVITYLRYLDEQGVRNEIKKHYGSSYAEVLDSILISVANKHFAKQLKLPIVKPQLRKQQALDKCLIVEDGEFNLEK